MTDERPSVTDLGSLTDKQFAEAFDRIARSRAGRGETRVLLTAAVDETGADFGPALFALPAGDDSWDDDAPICQEAAYPECGRKLASWAKRMRCPVCGAEGPRGQSWTRP